jgi:hypothetical protein
MKIIKCKYYGERELFKQVFFCKATKQRMRNSFECFSPGYKKCIYYLKEKFLRDKKIT